MLEINKTHNENCLDTTAKMALLNNRNYVGSEMSEKYCQIIEQRLAQLK